MKVGAVLSFLGCILVAASAVAADAPAAGNSNPYSIIAERNVFHLNPLPPPPAPDVPKVDLPVIKLSGFLKIGDAAPRALFSSVPKDKKDPPKYYDLAEGEKQDILEVVKIREDKGEVDIINSGTPVTLNLKDDTLASTGGSAKSGNDDHGHRQDKFGGMQNRGWSARNGFHGPGSHPNMPFGFPSRQ